MPRKLYINMLECSDKQKLREYFSEYTDKKFRSITEITHYLKSSSRMEAYEILCKFYNNHIENERIRIRQYNDYMNALKPISNI